MRLTLLSLGLAIAAAVFPHRVIRLVAGVVLGGFALVSGFSIGLFDMPAAAAMVVAASMGRSGR